LPKEEIIDHYQPLSAATSDGKQAIETQKTSDRKLAHISENKQVISEKQAIETSDRKTKNKRLTSDNKRFILSYIKKHSETRISEFSANLNLSQARIRVILQEMINDNLIEKVGDKRYTYYVLKR